MLRLVASRQLAGAVNPDGERADRVPYGRYVVREAAVRPLVAVVGLLAQEAEPRPLREQDVVPVGGRSPVAVAPDAL